MNAPADLLPHAAPMILLDEIVASDETSLVARVAIGPSSPFADADGVPAYVGLEYMAQACGAWIGTLARAAGRTPRIGYLLGSRDFIAHTSRFAPGDALDVAVVCLYRDAEMAAFDCAIRRDGDLLAAARVSVYQPAEAGSG